MKILKGILAAAIFGSAIFSTTSCSKEEELPAVEETKTKTEFITQNKWMLTELLVKDPILGVTLLDLYTTALPDCQKDNLEDYKSDLSYEITEETDVCSPSTARTGTWLFTDSETKLETTHTLSGTKTSFDIVTLNDSIMEA